jgi:hypothetical protein
MASDAPSLLDFIFSATWQCIEDTPVLGKNPLFTWFITSLEDVHLIASGADIHFAPGLAEALGSETPPGADFFMSLPTGGASRWAVYAIVMEKDGCRPRVYVGVATNAVYGAIPRFKLYDNREALPRHVKYSLAEGFDIVQKGLLCWMPIPTAGMVPMSCLLFYALEATFAYLFWAMKCSLDKDFGMGHMCLWDRAELEYDGLCSHSSLNDGIIGDFELSPEDLELVAIEKERKFREHKKENAYNHHYKQMATNYDHYIGASHDRVRKSRALHPEKHCNAARARGARVVKANTHHCGRCRKSYSRPAILKEHLKSDAHLRRKDPDEYKNFCRPCHLGFDYKSNFNRHNKTQGHLLKVAAEESL